MTAESSGNLPIPMLARPLDMVFGAPDPAYRMVAFGLVAVWLSPLRDGPRAPITEWAVNPGEPGEPELLPWKRRPS